MEPDFLSPDAEHVHDQTITSVGINEPGASFICDEQRVIMRGITASFEPIQHNSVVKQGSWTWTK